MKVPPRYKLLVHWSGYTLYTGYTGYTAFTKCTAYIAFTDYTVAYMPTYIAVW